MFNDSSIIKKMMTGQTDSHLSLVPNTNIFLHKDVINAFLALQNSAEQAGFELAIASGFRSFEKQCVIWNEKVQGKRPILCDDGTPLNCTNLSEWELIQGILRWSALPGASRHHWGTDFDVYDKRAMSPDYCLRLTAAETEPGGIFDEFYRWLGPQIQNRAFGFFRPYEIDCGGIGCEPWHLSYQPVADTFQENFTVEILRNAIRQSTIELQATVLVHLDEIFERFVKLPTP